MARPESRGARHIRRLFLPTLALLWWWAALRLVLHPGQAGTLHSLFVAGGWSLSLLPVHCVEKPQARPGRRGRRALRSPPRTLPGADRT